jgi:hypothetical protein
MWAASDGPTEEEQIKYAEDALVVVKDEKHTLVDNVKEVGVWANQVDVAFDNVTRGFEEMVVKYGHDFPEISDYLTEWKGYKTVRSSFRLLYPYILTLSTTRIG